MSQTILESENNKENDSEENDISREVIAAKNQSNYYS